MKKQKADRKPSVTLLHGEQITAEKIGVLFKKLSGREATKEETEDARRRLAAEKKKQLVQRKLRGAD